MVACKQKFVPPRNSGSELTKKSVRNKLRKRSISDYEISIIKKLISRGMKNQEIQFLFNRPDRPVNSGRIAQIKDGTYSNSLQIPSAADSEVEKFLSNLPDDTVGVVSIPHSPGANTNSPIDDAVLMKMFEKGPNGEIFFTPGETDSHECKASFKVRNHEAWLRAIAALANNRGGYLLFGVVDPANSGGSNEADGKYIARGLTPDEFSSTDASEISTIVRGYLDPTPRFEKKSLSVFGSRIGFIYVYRSDARPVILTKNTGKVREGDIFFRYPGESVRIKYSDLRQIMDERDIEARSRIVPLLTEVARLGPDRSMITDLEDGRVLGVDRQITFDGDLLKQIQAVKESDAATSPQVMIAGEIAQPSASNKVQYRTREIIEEYPFTATEIFKKIRKQLPGVKQNEVWKQLRKLKGDSRYSAHNFRSKKQEREVLESGAVPSHISTIYNQSALERLVEIFQEKDD